MAPVQGAPAQAPIPTPPRPQGPLINIKAEWAVCTKDTECVHAPADCCGCKSGGMSVAMNPRFLGELGQARQAVCEGYRCPAELGTDVSCRSSSICRNGRCVMEPPVDEPAPIRRLPHNTVPVPPEMRQHLRVKESAPPQQ